MRALDAMPEVEKTSIFGTAVHAVLRRATRHAARSARLERGTAFIVVGISSSPRSKTSSSTSPSRRRHEAVWKTLAVARKELRQIRRDRRSCSSCSSCRPSSCSSTATRSTSTSGNIRLAVQDNDRSTRQPRGDLGLRQSGYFDLSPRSSDDAEIYRLLDRGDVRAVLVIPARFGGDAAAGRPTSRAAPRQRRQREHGDDRRGLRGGARQRRVARYEVQARLGRRGGPVARPSSRASGTTPSCAARCSSCPG